jgi:putative redox protein
MEEVEETSGSVPVGVIFGAAGTGWWQCTAVLAALQYPSTRATTNGVGSGTSDAGTISAAGAVRVRGERIDMECTINWMPGSGMAFSAETGSGHLLTMDGAPDGGGRNLAPRPMETVLAGTGGCTAYDVVLILQRGRHDVRGCQVVVTSERAPEDPKVFTRIHLHFVVSGPALPLAAVERAVRLSHEKYCSATIMLGKTAEISTSCEVRAG